jgi:multiple sugar transport system substrate-binding protein
LVKGASYHGGIYGAPFFAGQGLFYYRKDLLAEEHLPVPTTWKQVVSESKQLQAANLVKYGFVWQGASYEGLTCNWMEFASDAGATVLNNSGTKATIDSKASLKALNFMTELIKSGVSPKGEVTFQEPQTTAIFDAGNAAFMRMWDSAYAQAESPTTSKVAGKVGVEPLPTFAGQPKPGYSTVGGWNLYINPHSKNVKADLTFIKFMTSSQAQTILSTYTIPTVQSVRTSKAVTSKSPVLAIIGKTKLIDRPSFSPNYPKVSSAVYTNINAALSGTTSPKSALSTAQSHINSAVSGKSF